MNKTIANKVKCQEENRMRQRDGERLSEQFKMGWSGKGSEKKIWSLSRCPNEKMDLARWINAREAHAELVPRSTSGDTLCVLTEGGAGGPAAALWGRVIGCETHHLSLYWITEQNLRTQHRLCDFHSQKTHHVAVKISIFLTEQWDCSCLENIGIVQKRVEENSIPHVFREVQVWNICIALVFLPVDFRPNDLQSLATHYRTTHGRYMGGKEN